MSSTEIVINDTHFDTIDTNIIPDTYVTWIVDIWQGQRHDPAATITRFIGVWRADDLEDDEGNARDPDFTKYASRERGASPYGGSHIDPRPLHWDILETIKDGDRDARNFKEQQNSMLSEGGWGVNLREKEMYQQFMQAIEVLAVDDTDESAWEAVGVWRQYQATKHEK